MKQFDKILDQHFRSKGFKKIGRERIFHRDTTSDIIEFVVVAKSGNKVVGCRCSPAVGVICKDVLRIHKEYREMIGANNNPSEWTPDILADLTTLIPKTVVAEWPFLEDLGSGHYVWRVEESGDFAKAAESLATAFDSFGSEFYAQNASSDIVYELCLDINKVDLRKLFVNISNLYVPICIIKGAYGKAIKAIESDISQIKDGDFSEAMKAYRINMLEKWNELIDRHRVLGA